MGFDYAAKIRTMLAMADSHEADGNDGLAAQIRTQVEGLMRRWKIEQEDMIAENPFSVLPTHLITEVNPKSWEVAHFYHVVARIVGNHVGARIYTESLKDGGYRITAVGYDNDLKYFEFLLTSAFLMFSTKIDPHWDSNRSEAENVYLMRQAGIKRKEIADAAWGRGAGDVAANRSKVQRLYQREAQNRGEQALASGLGFQAKDYRVAYAQAFVDRLSARLRQGRDASDTAAGGGVLILHGRSERVDEAFYQRFPNQRPSQDVEVTYVAPNANCEKCKRAASGFCREHGYLKPRAWSNADERRWQNRENGASAQAGRAGGRAAADGVLLRGTASTSANRLNASNIAIEG